jgi:hypothetical protein
VKKTIKKPVPFPFEEQAELALKAAVKRVIEENARLGLPLYVGREGKVVEVFPDGERQDYRTRPQKIKR